MQFIAKFNSQVMLNSIDASEYPILYNDYIKVKWLLYGIGPEQVTKIKLSKTCRHHVDM